MSDDEDKRFPALTPATVGGDMIQAVNARDLHAFLQAKKDFSTWIKDRIEKYGFTENVDFVAYDAAPQNGGVGNRGARIEYAISIDMAKELSMVERNAKGKEARQYFIAMERKAKEIVDPTVALNDPATLRVLLLNYDERVLALENKVADDAPKVAFADQITVSAGSVTVAQAAKVLGTGRNRLMQKLREWKWVTRLGEPYQEKINAGLLDVKIGSWEHPDKGLQRSVTALITGKGLRKLWGLFFPDADPAYSLN